MLNFHLHLAKRALFTLVSAQLSRCCLDSGHPTRRQSPVQTRLSGHLVQLALASLISCGDSQTLHGLPALTRLLPVGASCWQFALSPGFRGSVFTQGPQTFPACPRASLHSCCLCILPACNALPSYKSGSYRHLQLLPISPFP